MQSLECLDMEMHTYNQVDGFSMLKYSDLNWELCSLQTEGPLEGFRLDGPSSSMVVLPMSPVELKPTHSVRHAGY